MAAVRPGVLKGYDHDELSHVSFEMMSQVALQDYPVIFWLQRILPPGGRVLDAGGHLGTKFRAFRPYLQDQPDIDWWVYDLPAFVRSGEALAKKEGLMSLRFVADIGQAPAPHVFLGSGLLQYLDVPLAELMGRVKSKPRHLLLNKVATREGPSIFTLENFGQAEVPYHIRSRADVVASIEGLGYEIRDEWTIPDLSHAIPGNRQFGASTSRGYYAIAKDAVTETRLWKEAADDRPALSAVELQPRSVS
jgi:putative methyltransferase (TIGR04325 family)